MDTSIAKNKLFKKLIISVGTTTSSQGAKLVFEKKLRTFFGFYTLRFMPCVRPWSKFILSVRESFLLLGYIHELSFRIPGGIVNWNLLSFFTKANLLLDL